MARKGLSNHRWIVGAKLAVVTDDCGQIVSFGVAGANGHDTHFHLMIDQWKEQMIMLADQAFKAKDKTNKTASNPPTRSTCWCAPKGSGTSA